MANGARAKKEARMITHGWFELPNRPGDRTLDEQLRGLELLMTEVKGKTILDVGCAEGLIGFQTIHRGAASVHGIESVQGHVDIATSLIELEYVDKCSFEQADANEYVPKQLYDIVLLLAILHKLKNPSAACTTFADATKNLCVIRMGLTGGQKIVDPRSNNEVHHIGRVMANRGFVMEHKASGPRSEDTWYYRRKI